MSSDTGTIKSMDISEAISACAGMKALYPRLVKLALLIQEFEGYASGPPGRSFDGTLSFRNNNPGNLRSSPFSTRDHGGYAVFNDYFEGLYALLWDLWSKCQGRTSTGLGPDSFIRDLIEVWAPAEDNNDPMLYANFILSGLELSEDVRLSWVLDS